jgi:YebC/PmpR family DNA-binding regulatory protein
MGRIFEKRKHKMFARYAKMAKIFTRIGKEIAMAAKSGGPDPTVNPRLRLAIQNAKANNMPKANVDAAIKRATNKDEKDYEEIVYEGYAPHGIAIVIETATDNPTRTVANIRMYLTRAGGSLGKTGSLDFLFERKGVFKINPNNKNLDDLELQLIDYGLEEINKEEDGEVYIYTDFKDFGNMQKGLDEVGVEIISAELERIPTNTIKLSPEQQAEVLALIEKIEDDDDVQNVFHNLEISES